MRAFLAVMERLWWSLLVTSSLLVVAPGWALAQAGAEVGVDEARLAEARRHFELGVAHFDRKEWQAALVEFLRSRELAPARANTKNAAICLRKVGRFDEALDLFERLLRDFPELPEADRELAEREISELGASVGTLEIRGAPAGASVSIDGVERGIAPLPGPVRLPAGTHTVRVVKQGLLPFEARVDLAGRQALTLPVRLTTVTQAGRLRVVEKSGRNVEVVIDGSPVGPAPWEGALAPGAHSVALRGEDTLGVPPTQVSVAVERETVLELSAVPLASELALNARPEAAQIFVDGALAGRGSWRGRLRPGGHRIEVTLGGYEPFSQTLTLSSGEKRSLSVELEPFVQRRGIELELEVGTPVSLLWGGDLDDGCKSPCFASPPLGWYTEVHASYRFAGGVGLGVHAGYFRMFNTLWQREESVSVVNRPLHSGTSDDHLRLAGLVAGAQADYVTGKTWPLTLRLSAGALIGSVSDLRAASLVDSVGSGYRVNASQYPSASYLYLGPEVRVGYRGEHFGVSLGAKLLVFAALARPSWDGDALVYAGETDRGGYFPSATMTGAFMAALLPGVALNYAF